MRRPGKCQELQPDLWSSDCLERNGRSSYSKNISNSNRKKKTSPTSQCPKRSLSNHERRCHFIYAWTKENGVQSYCECVGGHKMFAKHNSEPAMLSVKSVVNSQGADNEIEKLTGVTKLMTESGLDIRPPSGFFEQTVLAQLLNIFKSTTQTEPSSRMLVTVTLLSSLHSIRVIVGHDATVKDVTEAALTAYAKEGRLPPQGSNPEAYGLHYSQFCLQSLNPQDSVRLLGARNFVLCPNKNYDTHAHVKSDRTAGTANRIVKPWWNILGVLPS